jgi:hypothetical protein
MASAIIRKNMIAEQLLARVTTELQVFSLVHRTHAPAADLAEDAAQV